MGILLAVTLAAAFSATHAQIRFLGKDLYVYSSNPDVPMLYHYQDLFGDPVNWVAVLVEADDVFQPEVLAYIADVTAALESAKAFRRVLSLSNVQLVHGDAAGVQTGPLLSPRPTEQKQAELARQLVQASGVLKRRLVSADSKVTLVTAELYAAPNLRSENDVRRRAIDALVDTVKRLPTPAHVHIRFTGTRFIEDEVYHNLVADQALLVPIALLLIMGVLVLVFRSLHGAILVTAAALIALIWTVALYPLIDRPIDLVGSVVPVSLLIYCAVDPIFILSRYFSKLDLGLDRQAAILATYDELMFPCFLTSATTALAFFSYCTLALPTISTFGFACGCGVLFAFVSTICVLPLLLVSLPKPARQLEQLPFFGWLDGALQNLDGALRRRGAAIVGVAVVFVVVCAAASVHQEVSGLLTDLLPDGPTRRAARILDDQLCGSSVGAILLEGEPGDMKKPEIIAAIATVDRAAEALPSVSAAISLADLIAEANQAFHDGDPVERKVPTSPALITQYLAILSPALRDDFVTGDYAATHILLSSTSSRTDIKRIEQQSLTPIVAAAFAGTHVRASFTGEAFVYARATDQTSIDMILGAIVGFFVIVLFALLFFRSWRIALITVLPNVVPMFACFALYHLLHVTLRVGTALVLGAAIGGLFNTTIHFAARVVQQIKSGARDRDAILLHAMRKTIPAALTTAGILSLGFGIFGFSQFPDLRLLGLLTAVVLSFGFCGDLLLTPVLFRYLYVWPNEARAAKEKE